MCVLEQLAEFIAEAEGKYGQNKWLEDDKMQVYVRRGMHYVDDKRCVCLDIANVTVHKQRQGTWTDFAAKAHDMNPWDCTYVECVHNPHLAAWLLRNGYAATQDGQSFYLMKEKP